MILAQKHCASMRLAQSSFDSKLQIGVIRMAWLCCTQQKMAGGTQSKRLPFKILRSANTSLVQVLPGSTQANSEGKQQESVWRELTCVARTG